MMKAILVDDEKQGLVVMRQMLKQYCPDVKVMAECQNAIEATAAINVVKPDILFLDIAMPGKSGIQMLNELDTISFMVVFVTAHDQYTLQAIKLSALDYLLKPVKEEDLIAAVSKARLKMNSEFDLERLHALMHNISAKVQNTSRITLPVSQGFVVKNLEDILYCAADNTYTKFYFTNNTMLMVTKPLSMYDNLLEGLGFLRIHKSYLVNEIHIIEFSKVDGGSVTLSNFKKLEVSKRKKDMITDFFKKKLPG